MNVNHNNIDDVKYVSQLAIDGDLAAVTADILDSSRLGGNRIISYQFVVNPNAGTIDNSELPIQKQATYNSYIQSALPCSNPDIYNRIIDFVHQY